MLVEHLTIDLIRSLFRYDAESGILIWESRPSNHFANEAAWKRWNTRYAGKVAGCKKYAGKNQWPYLITSINNNQFYVHQLIWIYVHGAHPSGFIDHINGDGTDNRISNLREVDAHQNGCNSKLRKNNTSGVKGVRWVEKDNRWYAQIKVKYKYIHLGCYSNYTDAVKARKEAEIKYHGEYAHKAGEKDVKRDTGKLHRAADDA
jgi:hypothetical protein